MKSPFYRWPRYLVGLCSFGATLCLGLLPAAADAPKKTLFSANQSGAPAPSFLSGALGLNASALGEVKPASDKVAIRLATDVFHREFLLQAAYTEYEETPKFHGLKSRVVNFKKMHNKVYMIEASVGNTGSEDLPTTLLLAEFPIVNETGDWVEIDWGGGMKNVFAAEDMHASDTGDGGQATPMLRAYKIRFDFVDSAVVTSENQIVIRQIAQLEVPNAQGAMEPTVEIKYYLTLYQPDKGFKPTVSKGFQKMGFFEVAPQFESGGGQVIYAAKYNTSKPIVYAISANTPAEYRKAIREGVLYWNKVLGEDRIQVVDAPAGIVPPDFNLNIIQWINYEEAGAAYADAQMDPRTGEILHAQVYLPSSFAIGGKELARAAVLRSQAGTVGAAPRAKTAGLVMSGGMTSQLCNLDIGEFASHSIAGLDAILSPDVPDDKLLKASQDTIRAVVAHEVGHTLGLRHNFAGSLASNLPRDEVDQIFANYLTGKTSSKLPSSTVMDYLEQREMMMMGDQIAHGVALDYDKKAMAALYKGKETPPEEMPPFCTDSAVGKYLDCQRFDAGKSVIASRTSRVALNSEQVAQTVLEVTVALTKTPPKGVQPMAVERLSFNPQALARFILGERHLLFAALTDQVQLLGVRRNMAFEGPLQSEEAKAAELDYLAKEFEQAGGVAKVFAPLPVDYADKVQAHWNALLSDKRFTSGKRKDGSTWQYSDAEVVKLKKFGEILFGKMKRSLVVEDILVMAGAAMGGKAHLVDHELSRDLATLLEQRGLEIITATEPGQDIVVPLDGPASKFFSEQFIEAKDAQVPTVKGISGALGGFPEVPLTPKPGVGTPSKVGSPATPATPPPPKVLTLPKFVYPLEIRRAAAGLLAPGRCEAPEWGLAERVRLHTNYMKFVQAALAGKLPPGELRPDALPRPLLRWLVEMKMVEAAIGG